MSINYDFIWNDKTYQSLITNLKSLLGSAEETESLAGIVNEINGLLNDIESEENWSGPSRDEYVAKWGDLKIDLNKSVDAISSYIKILQKERNKYIEEVITKIYNEESFSGFATVVGETVQGSTSQLTTIGMKSQEYINTIGVTNYVKDDLEE